MVSGHHLQQEVLLPRCHLQRRHRGNDCGWDQRPDQSTQRGVCVMFCHCYSHWYKTHGCHHVWSLKLSSVERCHWICCLQFIHSYSAAICYLLIGQTWCSCYPWGHGYETVEVDSLHWTGIRSMLLTAGWSLHKLWTLMRSTWCQSVISLWISICIFEPASFVNNLSRQR